MQLDVLQVCIALEALHIPSGNALGCWGSLDGRFPGEKVGAVSERKQLNHTEKSTGAVAL